MFLYVSVDTTRYIHIKQAHTHLTHLCKKWKVAFSKKHDVLVDDDVQSKTVVVVVVGDSKVVRYFNKGEKSSAHLLSRRHHRITSDWT